MSAGKLTGIVTGAVFAVLALILVLLIVGNAGMVTQINAAFAGICNSGWPLASLFHSSTGIVSLLLVVGLLIFAIVAAFQIGKSGGK